MSGGADSKTINIHEPDWTTFTPPPFIFTFAPPLLRAETTSGDMSYDDMLNEAATQMLLAQNPDIVLNKEHYYWYRITGSTGTGKSRVATQLARDLKCLLEARGPVLLTYFTQPSNQPQLPATAFDDVKLGDDLLRTSLVKQHIIAQHSDQPLDNLLLGWIKCVDAATSVSVLSRPRPVWIIVIDEFQRDVMRTRILLRRVRDRIFTGAADQIVILPIVCGLSAHGIDNDGELSLSIGSTFKPRAFTPMPLPPLSSTNVWEQVWTPHA